MTGPAPLQPKNPGRILFFVLLLVIGGIVLLYPFGTGPMGIEERFSSALGISHEEEGHSHDETEGFSIEGSPALYILVLALICLACWVLYRKFGA